MDLKVRWKHHYPLCITEGGKRKLPCLWPHGSRTQVPVEHSKFPVFHVFINDLSDIKKGMGSKLAKPLDDTPNDSS